MTLSPEASRRKALLPKWMIILIWMVFIVAILMIPFGLLGAILPVKMNISMYGIHYAGYGFNVYVLLMLILCSILALSCFGLLWGKKWGIYLGIVQSIIGIIFPIIAMVVYFDPNNIDVPLGPIISIFLAVKLFKIKTDWLKQ
jgi:hypothetical protein